MITTKGRSKSRRQSRRREARAIRREARATRRQPAARKQAFPVATEGSGNVFVDIGFSEKEAEELAVRSQLLDRVNQLLTARGLTQTQMAELLGINQPRVSALRNEKLSIFSLEALMRYMVLLGQEVEILVRPANEAHLKVTAAA